MDLTTTPTKSPDTDNDTPPHHAQPIKTLSFSNGTLKRHHHHFHHHQPSSTVVAYRECLKNHAASMGGHAVDGCGEFMPCPSATPSDPTSLKCAACGCHRNFHRREPDDSQPPSAHILDFRHYSAHPVSDKQFTPSPSPPPPQAASAKYSYASQMLLALSTAVPEDHQLVTNHFHVTTPVTPTGAKAENLSGRKRFRTKFSAEQKEKMHLFSEKLGWKMQRADDAMVEEFCNEIGVAKGVLKVWMHNNKNTLGKRDLTTGSGGAGGMEACTENGNIGNGNGRVSFENNDYDINGGISNDEENQNSNNTTASHSQQNDASALQFHVSTNGSSSSS